jgi:hypothetical protein
MVYIISLACFGLDYDERFALAIITILKINKLLYGHTITTISFTIDTIKHGHG